MKIRVLIADDHKRFREALRRMLEGAGDIEVVAEVAAGDQVVAGAAHSRPDVVCMDYRMPGMDGIEATRQLVRAFPGVLVIGLSANAEQHFAFEMRKAGAVDYVAKNDAALELVGAIRSAVAHLPGRGVGADTAPVESRMEQAPSPGELTSREREILAWLAEGISEFQIAEQLRLAPSLVSIHLRNTMRKLNVHSVAELARIAGRG